MVSSVVTGSAVDDVAVVGMWVLVFLAVVVAAGGGACGCVGSTQK